MGHIPKPEGDAHAIKGLIFKGELLGINLSELYSGGHAIVDQPITPAGQHFSVDVGENHAASITHTIPEKGGHIAGATG